MDILYRFDTQTGRSETINICMIFRNPYMLSLLVLLPVVVLLWQRRVAGMYATLAVRVVVIILLVLALADPTIGQPPAQPGPLVLLVDQSDSLTTTGQAALRSAATSLAKSEAAPAGEQATQPVLTLWFGSDVVISENIDETDPQHDLPLFLRESLDPTASNLEQALQTARELLATTEHGRIIVLSDGIQNSGDALYEAEHAAHDGIRIDVVPYQPNWEPDMRIAQVTLPPSLRIGEEYQVRIDIERREHSPPLLATMDDTGTTPVVLQLWESTATDEGTERLIAQEEVLLKRGYNNFTLNNEATASGLVKIRAALKDVSDTFQRNNTASATTMVKPAPRILIVEGKEGTGQEFASAIWPAIESDVIAAQDLPARLSQLELYTGMVLVDVSTYNLSLDQMSTVREFVRSEGRGLVVTGGRHSYSLGGYGETPFEDMLPVKLDPPPRSDRSDIALLLVMDRSASMSIPIDVSKFDMAKEAAILSTEMLQSHDTIGILAFDTRLEWTVPFQSVGEGLSLKQIQDQIVMLDIGGGTDIYSALEEGLLSLMQQNASVRHAVLLTDGRSFTNDQDAYEQLVQTAQDNQITLSSIAIGIDADIDLLEKLAQWGNGRYYYADKPEDIPRLTIQESEIARADPIIEGTVPLEIAAPHPVLHGIETASIPSLSGYVAVTRRDGADVVLQTPGTEPGQHDPLLATWHYGLGRVVAWTPSLGDPWATEWDAWSERGAFWTQVIRYTLPQPDSGPLQIELEPLPDGVRLMVDAFDSNGDPLLADAVARVSLPNGTRQEFALHQTAPGRYSQDLLLSSDGAYHMEVLLMRDGKQYYAEKGYVHAVPAEYNPYQEYDPGRQGNESSFQGVALLERMATLTGGKILSTDELTLPSNEQTDENAAGGGFFSSQFRLLQTSLWPWLMSVALLLWLVEIAFRKKGKA